MKRIAQCHLCAGTDLRPYAMVAWGSDDLHFAQVRCGDCGLLVSQPQATEPEAEAYYKDSYFEQVWPDVESIWKDNTQSYRAYEWRLFQALWKDWPPRRGRAVEVGCGYGVMLGVLRQEGFQVCGCDLSPAAVSVGHGRGLNVVVGKTPGLPWRDKEFDLACALHVIEHVAQPSAFVEELVGLVRPGGVVAIATEDGWTTQNEWNRFKARLAGELPRPHTSSDHTFVFQARHLETLLRRGGCDEVRTLSYSRVAPNESLHWKVFKGACRQIDRLLGHGDYLLAVGRRRADG